MTSRERIRGLARLAALQRVVLDDRRQEFGRRCADTGRADAAEADARADCQAAARRLDGVFAATRLSLDDVTIAALNLQGTEAALHRAEGRLEDARRAEDRARSAFAESEHRRRLLDRMARETRRKHAEKASDAAIAEAIALATLRKRGA